MKKAGVALAITALFALIGVFTYAALNNSANVVKTAQSAPSTVSEQPKPPTRPELLKLVNAERKKYGAKPLVIDERLNKSAQYKADDMAKRHYFGHEDPKTGKKNGLDYSGMLIKCTWVSENIRENGDVNDSKHTVAAWISSKPHRKAILDPQYEITGFGINGNLIVEHFCNI